MKINLYTRQNSVRGRLSRDKRNTLRQAFVDKAYRGTQHHPQGVEVYVSGQRNLGRRLSDWLARRSAIEPIIGHAKADHRMDRNFLIGRVGDRINAMLSGCGFNLRKLLRGFFAAFFLLFILFNRKKQKAELAVFLNPAFI